VKRWRALPARGLGVLALLAGALLAGAALGATPSSATSTTGAGSFATAAGVPPPVTVTLDRQDVAVGVGQGFELVSSIENDGPTSLRGLIAHIDVVGTDPARYVDPEDWCTARTVFLDELEPGGSTAATWQIQAVDSGPLLLWVTVSQPDGAGVAVSAPVRLTVGEHIDVNSGGVLPVVVGVPAAVGAGLVLLTGWRRRQEWHPERPEAVPPP
jgi:hypothetical protein